MRQLNCLSYHCQCQCDWREKAARGAARRQANSSEFQKTRRRPDWAWGWGSPRSVKVPPKPRFCRLTPGPRASCFLLPIGRRKDRASTKTSPGPSSLRTGWRVERHRLSPGRLVRYRPIRIESLPVSSETAPHATYARCRRARNRRGSNRTNSRPRRADELAAWKR
jgi:hypothetical protein